MKFSALASELKFAALAANFGQFPWRAWPAILRLAAQDRELSVCLQRHIVKFDTKAANFVVAPCFLH